MKFVHEPEDGAILPVDRAPAPQTLSGLLSRLHVTGAAHDAQRLAVGTWLQTNEPERFLRDQLEERGLLPTGRHRAA